MKLKCGTKCTYTSMMFFVTRKNNTAHSHYLNLKILIIKKDNSSGTRNRIDPDNTCFRRQINFRIKMPEDELMWITKKDVVILCLDNFTFFEDSILRNSFPLKVSIACNLFNSWFLYPFPIIGRQITQQSSITQQVVPIRLFDYETKIGYSLCDARIGVVSKWRDSQISRSICVLNSFLFIRTIS